MKVPSVFKLKTSELSPEFLNCIVSVIKAFLVVPIVPSDVYRVDIELDKPAANCANVY